LRARYNAKNLELTSVKHFYFFVMALVFCVARVWGDSSLSLSAFSVEGDYGNDRETSTHYVPLQYIWRKDALKIFVLASYLEIDGISGNRGGPLDTNGALPTSGNAQGLGDSYLKASYEIPAFTPRVALRPQLKIKIPTADEEKGLGSGEFDYQAQLDSFFYVRGWWPYVSMGYRWRGDGAYDAEVAGKKQRIEMDFDNGAVIGAGIYRNFSAATSLTVSYEHREPGQKTRAAVEEVMATLQYQFDAQWLAACLLGTGFTSASADQIVGLQTTYRF